MSIRRKRNLLLVQLSENFVLLEKSMTALAYSYEKCDAIEGQWTMEAGDQKSAIYYSLLNL